LSLVIERAIGLVTIQDLGRPGHMHEGLAPGGALVPELLIAANRRASNPDNAPALEVMGMVTVRAETRMTVAAEDRSARQLSAGETVTIAAGARRVVYLAVRGGVNAPLVLGSFSVQLSAGLGERLKAGSRIDIGTLPPATMAPEPFLPHDRLRVIPGPDLGHFPADALDRLTTGAYTVLPTSDRVGTRLQGPAIVPSGVDVTRPMVCGAIEIPPDGQPIVLGPEHPTTGGYPVVAVIASVDRGRFHALPIGGLVRFVSQAVSIR